MKCEIREICGDWALDMHFPFETVTVYFNSRQNAENVKKIIETDKSIPNAATVCDMQEVVRCKDCKWWQENGFCKCNLMDTADDFYCAYAENSVYSIFMGNRKGGTK